MKWRGACLYSVHRMCRNGSSFMWHLLCWRCKYTTLVDIQKHALKKLFTRKITCERSESAQEWRIVLYKSDQQQQHYPFTCVCPGTKLSTQSSIRFPLPSSSAPLRKAPTAPRYPSCRRNNACTSPWKQQQQKSHHTVNTHKSVVIQWTALMQNTSFFQGILHVEETMPAPHPENNNNRNHNTQLTHISQ